MWLVPPIMKNQMTVLALGLKCGFPSGDRQPAVPSFATPSRCSIALKARPVNPIPVSARNERRDMRARSSFVMSVPYRMVTKSL